MIELFILAIAGAGIAYFARRRGSRGWPFVLVMLVGYLAIIFFVGGLYGRGPAWIAGIAWCFLVYGAVFFLVGGGRRAPESWQCPECHLFNEPTTLHCACGYDYPLQKRRLKRTA